MKKLISSLIVILVIGAVGIFAFFDLTSATPKVVPEASIKSVEGTVQIRTWGETEWRTASAGDKLKAGDSIKTGPDSGAELAFFDNSTSRLSHDAEVLLETLYVDPANTQEQKINIQVFQGKVWSRIIKLLDKDASFSVMSSTTVATVRGTAVDFRVTEQGALVMVDESQVEVKQVQSEDEIDPLNGRRKLKVARELGSALVDQGKLIEIDASKTESPILTAQDIPEEILKQEWVTSNRDEDKHFLKEIEEVTKKRLEAEVKISPDSPFYGMKVAAEKFRLRLAQDPDEKSELELEFLQRRFKEGQLLNLRGNGEEGQRLLQEFNDRLEEKMQDIESLPEGKREMLLERIEMIEMDADQTILKLPYREAIKQEIIESGFVGTKLDQLIEVLPDSRDDLAKFEGIVKDLVSRGLKPGTDQFITAVKFRLTSEEFINFREWFATALANTTPADPVAETSEPVYGEPVVVEEPIATEPIPVSPYEEKFEIMTRELISKGLRPGTDLFWVEVRMRLPADLLPRYQEWLKHQLAESRF